MPYPSGPFTIVDMPELSTVDEVRCFDSAVCRSGIKVFVRKISNAERQQMQALPEEGRKLFNECNHVLIWELKPGFRMQSFMNKFVEVGRG